jgi:endonuclease YncB( thermonuclease family)
VFLESVLFGIKEIIVKTSSSDKYDRYLADVFVDDMFVNQLLINEGFAETV